MLDCLYTVLAKLAKEERKELAANSTMQRLGLAGLLASLLW